MEIKNAKYSSFGDIDCEINHPKFGWIPFTASLNDSEDFGKTVFDLASNLGPEPFVPPKEPTQEDLLQEKRKYLSCTQTQGRVALGQNLCQRLDAFISSQDCPWELSEILRGTLQWQRLSTFSDELSWTLNLDSLELDTIFEKAMTV